MSLKKVVERELAKLEHGKSPCAFGVRLALVDLFLPAGDLQEVSMANGWADEFLRLSEVIDRSIKPAPG